jgi:integrative and conjugative element protein (TIGR02256 family)
VRSQAAITFRPGAKESIFNALADSNGLETGGILVGPPHARDPLLVTHAIGPGPNALQSYSRFERDTTWCQERLSQLQQMLSVEWIGDWHSHPESMFEPSITDIATAQALLEDPELGFDSYLMVVVCPQATRSPVTTAWLFRRDDRERLQSIDLSLPEFQGHPTRIIRRFRHLLRGRTTHNTLLIDVVDPQSPHDV